jgi:tetratricopeptide (TPR) repeat protein
MFRVSRVLLAAAGALVLAGVAPAQDLEDGVRLYNEGQVEQAIGVLEPVVAAPGADARAHGYFGLALVEAGRMDEAEGHLNAALAGEVPERARFLVGLARVHLERRDAAAAAAVLNEAETLDPANADIFYYRGLAHAARQDFAQSARDMERALMLDPGRAMAHYYAGLAYNGLRQRDRMLQHFQMFLRDAPDAPEAERVRSLLRSAR